ncbi:hypothetical protein [Rugamonas sp.]|uniref:hypothetical protein n=1 Tax=Rugamonas sp. TaxID=1926287 RepID=UPI0025D87FF5|nr:hypothetical protein [Rugamonas sp.]
MKVLFDTKKVQKTGRIALSEQLLRNAGLQEGDSVDIYFDASSKRIILERADASTQPSHEGKGKKI